MNNKIITGFGRSGTKFLSHMIESCTELSSFHEKTANCLTKKYQVRTNTGFVEVNSYYRYCIDQKVADFYLVLRKPSEICLSISKRYKDKNQTIQAYNDLCLWYDFLDNQIHNVKKVYFFEFYTTNSEYLCNLFKDIGSNNVQKETVKLLIKEKINKSKQKAEFLEEVYTTKQIKTIKNLDLKYEKFKNLYNG